MLKDPKQILLGRFNSKQKDGLISTNQLKQALLFLIKGIDQQDFMYLYEDLTQGLSQLTFQQFFELYYVFQHEAKKVFNRIQSPISLFLFDTIISVESQKIVCKDISNPNDKKIGIQKDFVDILSGDYLKKLLNMGANGLINQKQEEKIERYYYYHWVESSVDFLTMPTQKLEVQLLKAIWNFDFELAHNIALYEIYLKNYHLIYHHSSIYHEQIAAILPGLQNLKEAYQLIHKYPTIKHLLQSRQSFQIQILLKNELFKKGSSNKANSVSAINFSSNQASQFEQTIHAYEQVMQILSFTSEYFIMIQDNITNPEYRMLCQFLSNTQDDQYKSMSDIQVFASFQEIGIIERFLYAKKFFTYDNFEMFKNIIKERINFEKNIHYILLFGNKKQSEIILQNYLDYSNDIQKVALISVYLKTFSQQSKISIRQQKSLYTKFIKVYEWLLDKKDGGISRHLFDKKCLSIQIQRKRKNLTKTYTFDCTNCKAPQIYSALAKKIGIDSKQPKLKGYHYFAKDSRSQIMHCIQCMQLLPKCSICLYPIAVFNAYAQEMKKNASQKKFKNQGEQMDMALVWCPKCKHGGHFKHIMEWFQGSGGSNSDGYQNGNGNGVGINGGNGGNISNNGNPNMAAGFTASSSSSSPFFNGGGNNQNNHNTVIRNSGNNSVTHDSNSNGNEIAPLTHVAGLSASNSYNPHTMNTGNAPTTSILTSILASSLSFNGRKCAVADCKCKCQL